MDAFNVIWVFNADSSKVLMCKRHKEPYLGLYNLVGGKIEDGEDGLSAAYRELEEETGIVPSMLVGELHHLMNFTYFANANVSVEVYAGKLSGEALVCGDEKELVWMDADSNFFDMKHFAGEGNIGHIYEIIKMLRPDLL